MKNGTAMLLMRSLCFLLLNTKIFNDAFKRVGRLHLKYKCYLVQKLL